MRIIYTCTVFTKNDRCTFSKVTLFMHLYCVYIIYTCTVFTSYIHVLCPQRKTGTHSEKSKVTKVTPFQRKTGTYSEKWRLSKETAPSHLRWLCKMCSLTESDAFPKKLHQVTFADFLNFLIAKRDLTDSQKRPTESAQGHGRWLSKFPFFVSAVAPAIFLRRRGRYTICIQKTIYIQKTIHTKNNIYIHKKFLQRRGRCTIFFFSKLPSHFLKETPTNSRSRPLQGMYIVNLLIRRWLRRKKIRAGTCPPRRDARGRGGRRWACCWWRGWRQGCG